MSLPSVSRAGHTVVSLALGITLLLAGCVSEPDRDRMSVEETQPAAEATTETLGVPAGAADSATTPDPAPGVFVTQWTETTGQVTLETGADGHLYLQLTDFKTGTAEDLRVWLNSGPVVRGEDGYYRVEDPEGAGYQHEVGPLSSNSGDQEYDLTLLSGGLPDVKSITIYDYANRIAFGSANLPLPIED